MSKKSFNTFCFTPWKRQFFRFLWFFLGILIIFFLFASQIIKYELITHFSINRQTNLNGIQVKENASFFFGLVSKPSMTTKIILMIFQSWSIILIALIACKQKERKMQFCLLLILVGSLGNLINRFWNNGKVIDYIEITWKENYINFNLEDVCIISGSILIVFLLITSLIPEKRK